MSTYTQALEFTTVRCGACDVVFGMLTLFYNARRDDHRTWYCPNGHARCFGGDSEEEKLRKQLKNTQEALSRESIRNNELREDVRSMKFKLQSSKMHAGKLRKRISGGVCPCCTRTFQNLGRHMASQHPTYAAPSHD